MTVPPPLAQQTLDALSLNLAVLGSTGEIVATNRAWQQFGQDNDGPVDSVGENYLHVTHAADDEYATEAAAGLRAVVTGERDTFELEYPCHSPAEKRWFSMHASRFVADDEPYTVVAHEDITERRRAERQVLRRNEDLEAFARLLSHDLRNPLNVAAGNAELLREETDSERVGVLQSSLERMYALIEDALAVLRSDTAAVQRTRVSLRTVAERAWATVETGDAALVVESETDLQADVGLLTNVFENLFRNAIEHAGPDVTVTVGALDNGFYVEDTGPGIPEASREDVFELGFTTSSEGNGLGLEIVRRVVGNHGWEIALESGETGGARFEIYTRPVSAEKK